MTQQELERELCAAPGKSLSEIRHLGFSLADPTDVNFDPEPNCLPAHVLDWENHQGGRPIPTAGHSQTFLPRRSA